MLIARLAENPIIRPHMDARMGANINGPSLVQVPDWIRGRLGRYYLYFGDHRGTYIRLAYAQSLSGPWRIYTPGALDLASAHMQHHLASPDLHVDPDQRRLIMYYHGRDPSGAQLTRVATSSDGVRFRALKPPVARPYLRVWRWQGLWYGLTMQGYLYRSADPLSPFECGPRLPFDNQRHLAVTLRGDRLHVFYTRWYDAPERILHTVVRLQDTWDTWRLGEIEEVLRPVMDYEGAKLPLAPSEPGPVREPVNQLRDPAIYEESGRTYLLYSVAGESGIAIAQIMGL
jgi:hypothetical protein